MDAITVFALLKKKVVALQREIDELGDVLSWLGVTTTALSDGSTANPIVINGKNVTAKDGGVTSYDGIEYVFNGTAWQEFGRDTGAFITKAGLAQTTGQATDNAMSQKAVTDAIPSVPSAYTSNPEMNGTASPGSSSEWAKGDHVHPSDNSKQAKITATGMLKGDGNGGVSAATVGTDYLNMYAITQQTGQSEYLIMSQKAVTDKLAEAGTIPDWNESNSIAKDYIKNRTHYHDEVYASEPSVTASTSAASTSSSSITFNGVTYYRVYYRGTGSAYGDTGKEMYLDAAYFQLPDGSSGTSDLYKVKIDSDEYIVNSEYDSGASMQGHYVRHLDLSAQGFYITSEYYYYSSVDKESKLYIYAVEGTGAKSFKFYQNTYNYTKTLDNAYLDMDSTPRSGSSKPVKSSGLNTALSGKQAKITASGMLKGDGNGGVSAATSGTDYISPSGLAQATGQATTNAMSQKAVTDELGNKQAKVTASGILKGDGNGGISAATAGTDYISPSGLVQTTGTAANKAMSQNAVTNAIPHPDWNEMDNHSKNYIANRTHYLDESFDDYAYISECYVGSPSASDTIEYNGVTYYLGYEDSVTSFEDGEYTGYEGDEMYLKTLYYTEYQEMRENNRYKIDVDYGDHEFVGPTVSLQSSASYSKNAIYAESIGMVVISDCTITYNSEIEEDVKSSSIKIYVLQNASSCYVSFYKSTSYELKTLDNKYLDLDDTPHFGVEKPVKSGGVYSTLEAKQNAITATGVLKGFGQGAVGAATAGTDYIAPSGLAQSTGQATDNAMSQKAVTDELSNKQASITASGILKGNGSGVITAASSGTDYEAPVKQGTIVLSSSDWSGAASPYTQQNPAMSGVTITANTKVDLQPTAAQIASLISDGVSGLVVENNNGTLTVYSVGAKPSSNITIQCTATEVVPYVIPSV